MAYFTEQQLENYASSYQMENVAESVLKSASVATSKRVFLSHSHKDKKLAKGLRNWLAGFGINLYIDWEDASMPHPTNRETADRLKIRIKASHFVIVLMTENAALSRWVPWEIGIADNSMMPHHIWVVPVRDKSGQFHGSEYLQLYRRVELYDLNKAGLYQPNESKGLDFESVLRVW